MGRPCFVDLSRMSSTAPDKPYYVCAAANCLNHIGYLDDYVWSEEFSEDARYLIKLFNVVVDGPQHYRAAQGYQIADVHCLKCNTILGYKVVDSRTGMHIMEVSKLLVKIVGGDLEPATNDIQYRQHLPADNQ